MQMFRKILSGMANNVDSDQTAPLGSALFAFVILSDTLVSKILGHLPYSLEAPWQGASHEYPCFLCRNKKSVNTFPVNMVPYLEL